MTEPTKFTVSRFTAEARGRRSVAASYTFGSEAKARARFASIAEALPDAALKLTAWGAGQGLQILDARNL